MDNNEQNDGSIQGQSKRSKRVSKSDKVVPKNIQSSLETRADKTDAQKEAMVEAMVKALGVVSSAVKIVGISRETHYKWYREDESYKQRIDDVDNVALDFAESQLHKQIVAGSTAATIFFLKTKGKRRGYIERQEIIATNTNINHEAEPMSPEEIKKMSDELDSKY